MNMHFTKRMAALVLGAAVVAVPFAAFAHDDASKKSLQKGTAVQVVISDPGTALVRGAKVTQVSGSVISAQTVWSGVTLNWAINTASTTKFSTKGNDSSTLGAIAVGNTISFVGPLTGSLVVQAGAVKNWSIETVQPPVVTKDQKKYDGMVKSWFKNHSFLGFHFGKDE